MKKIYGVLLALAIFAVLLFFLNHFFGNSFELKDEQNFVNETIYSKNQYRELSKGDQLLTGDQPLTEDRPSVLGLDLGYFLASSTDDGDQFSFGLRIYKDYIREGRYHALLELRIKDRAMLKGRYGLKFGFNNGYFVPMGKNLKTYICCIDPESSKTSPVIQCTRKRENNDYIVVEQETFQALDDCDGEYLVGWPVTFETTRHSLEGLFTFSFAFYEINDIQRFSGIYTSNVTVYIKEGEQAE